MPKPRDGLTDKQKSFVEHYCTDALNNATKAALLAGYCAKTANKIGPANMVKVGVKQAIDKKKAEITQESGISAVFLTNKFLTLAQQAEAKGDTGEARRNYAEIGKHIGYYQGDRPLLAEDMIDKEVDAQRREDIRIDYNGHRAQKRRFSTGRPP
jgi:phage terminase small subunit